MRNSEQRGSVKTDININIENENILGTHTKNNITKPELYNKSTKFTCELCPNNVYKSSWLCIQIYNLLK